MATTFITTDQTATVVMTAGDQLVVLPGINVTVGSGNGIVGGIDSTVAVQGNVVASGHAVWIGDPTSDDDATLFVDSGGRLTSAGNSGATVLLQAGDFNHLINDGIITGLGINYAAVETYDNATITNTGTIHARSGAAIGGEDLSVFNSETGVIDGYIFARGETADLVNIRVRNMGEIKGHIYAFSDIDSVTVFNAGLIDGTIAGGSAQNSGRVKNAPGGVITGGVDMGAGHDYVGNRGFIGDNVYLRGGNDLYDGRGGVVVGMVQGGSGDDVYILDNDSTLVVEFGGQGTDEVRSLGDFTLPDNVENLSLIGSADVNGTGNTADNALTGNAGSNRLSGLEGNDTISGQGGDDTLFGDEGDDTLLGNHGDDIVRGGDGNDSIIGHLGEDLLSGGDGDDTLRGGPGDDTMVGGLGNDTITGNADDDVLRGGPGDDTLHGGSGDDTLIGGAGVDRLIGGTEADMFVFEAANDSPAGTPDIVVGFQTGIDRIDFGGLVPGQLSVNLLSGSFSGTGPELRTQEVGGNTRVYVDVDGDATADLQVVIQGVTGLGEADFIL